MKKKNLTVNINFDYKSLISGAIDRRILRESIIKSSAILLISAPSGFGKTFLLAGYLNDTNPDFLYYELSGADSNLINFLSSIINGCELNRKISDEINNTIQKNKLKLSKYSRDSYSLLQNILTELILESSKEVFIIENCDFIKSELWFKHFLKIISELFLKNKKFIFTGIDIPTGLFLYPVSKGMFTELRKDKFDLTIEEIKNFANKLYNLKINENECLTIKDITSGWITGLHLIFHNYNQGLKSVKGNHISLLKEYFKEEIISSYDNVTIELLCKSSFLDEINTSHSVLLNSKNDIPGIFKSLSAKNPFIYFNSASNSFYFNKTFRIFLQSELKNYLTLKNYKIFIDSIANYHLKNKSYTKSLELFILNGNTKSAINLITSFSLELFRNNDFYIVNNWFAMIKNIRIKIEKELLYIKALLYKNYFQKYDFSISLFKEFVKTASKTDLKKYKAIAHIAEIFINLNEIKYAISILKNSLSQCPLKYKPFILFRLHSVNYKLNDYYKCKVLLSEALDYINKLKSLSTEFHSLKMNIINATGNICLLNGELNNSLVYYKKVLESSENEYNKTQTLLNICDVYSKSGNFIEAIKIIKELKTNEKLFLIPELKTQINNCEINIYYESGDYKKMNFLISNNDNSDSCENKILEAKSHLILSDDDKVKSIIKNIKPESNSSLKIQLSIINSLLQKNFKQIKTNLNNLDSLNYPFLKIEFLSLIVIYLIRHNNKKLFSEYLIELKILNKKYNYENILKNLLKSNKEVYDKIIIEKIDPPYFREIYYNIRINDELFSDVFVKYFGVPEIFVRGNSIPDNLWKRNKFKEIFIYLFFNINKRVTKDEILERFYPEADKNYGDNIFHQFLSAMRNVLSYKLKNKNTEFIKYSHKIFEPDKNYLFNSDAEILKQISERKIISLPENYLIENYSEPFMKNYFDDFAETNREYFQSLIEKINSGR